MQNFPTGVEEPKPEYVTGVMEKVARCWEAKNSLGRTLASIEIPLSKVQPE